MLWNRKNTVFAESMSPINQIFYENMCVHIQMKLRNLINAHTGCQRLKYIRKGKLVKHSLIIHYNNYNIGFPYQNLLFNAETDNKR